MWGELIRLVVIVGGWALRVTEPKSSSRAQNALKTKHSGGVWGLLLNFTCYYSATTLEGGDLGAGLPNYLSIYLSIYQAASVQLTFPDAHLAWENKAKNGGQRLSGVGWVISSCTYKVSWTLSSSIRPTNLPGMLIWRGKTRQKRVAKVVRGWVGYQFIGL